jgi:UDP-GlcNAc:undecaprenyl-phosphate/decaprenyl-phosphate GlcNAc-1-phosphate transferase
MRALPFLLALAGGKLLAGPLLSSLTANGHERPNYRERRLPFPFGLLVAIVAPLALVPLLLIERLGETHVFEAEIGPVALYCLGIVVLGLIDDCFGRAEGAPRGWRGHGAAALRGEPSTGALKAAGSLGLALLATSYLDLSNARWLLASGVLVLATNVFNLLDLRPGRSIKAFVLLGAALTLGAWELWPLWTLGLFAGPALDTGANLLGALAGLWLVFTLSGTGQLIALLLLLLITIYGELRSISTLVEKTPGLRQLDSWGRP